MGHKGDIEARYSTNKGVLPPDMVEDMRKAYKQCEPFLSTMQPALRAVQHNKGGQNRGFKKHSQKPLGDRLD
jgi:hypothetical protein